MLAAQVAERSLFLWNNEYIVSLVAQQRTAVLPLVFAALERNERNHWNPQVGCIVPLESHSMLQFSSDLCHLLERSNCQDQLSLHSARGSDFDLVLC